MAQSSDKRIVVGVDGSESSLQALEWAVRQAEYTGSVLEVITTWEWPTSYGWVAPVDGWDPQVDSGKMLEDIVGPVRKTHPNITVRPMVVEGRPAPVLIEASRGAELVVVGSRGHGEFSGMLLGSVGEHCVSHAHCPVLVLRDRT